MRVHGFGMHARVGAACCRDGRFGSKQLLKHLSHHFLHTDGIGLELPAVVVGAVVRKADEIALLHACFEFRLQR